MSPEINTHLQRSIDGVLDAIATVNVLGAALSYWAETYGDINGAAELAYSTRQKLLDVEENLSQVKGHLWRNEKAAGPDLNSSHIVPGSPTSTHTGN